MKLVNVENILAKAFEAPGYFCRLVSTWDIVHEPAVDAVEVIHAKWEPQNNSSSLQCSHCKREAPYNIWGHELSTKYCPGCGARMNEE